MLKEEVPLSGFTEVLFDLPGVAKGAVPLPTNKVLILEDKIYTVLLGVRLKSYVCYSLQTILYLPFLYFVCNSTLFQLENKGFSFLSIYSP